MASHDSEASRSSDDVRDPKSLRDAVIKRSFDEAKLDGRRLGRDFPRALPGEVSKGYYIPHGSGTQFCTSNPRKQQNHQRSKFAEFGNNKPEVKLPIFDGSSRTLDFLDWIDTFEDYFEAVDPPEAVKCKLVASKLKGEAHIWWRDLQNHRFSEGKNLITSWPRMSKLLIRKFLHTSRLTYFYKQEYEENVKHTKCSTKVHCESGSYKQCEKTGSNSHIELYNSVLDSSIKMTQAIEGRVQRIGEEKKEDGVVHKNNVGMLLNSSQPKPTNQGTIRHPQPENKLQGVELPDLVDGMRNRRRAEQNLGMKSDSDLIEKPEKEVLIIQQTKAKEHSVNEMLGAAMGICDVQLGDLQGIYQHLPELIVGQSEQIIGATWMLYMSQVIILNLLFQYIILLHEAPSFIFDPGGNRQKKWTTNDGHGPMIREAPTLVDSDATTLKKTKLQQTCFIVIGILVKQPEFHESSVSICPIIVDNSKLSGTCAENHITFEGLCYDPEFMNDGEVRVSNDHLAKVSMLLFDPGSSAIYERFEDYLFPISSIILYHGIENAIYNFFFNEITAFTLLKNVQLEREISRLTGVMKEEFASILSVYVSYGGVRIDTVSLRLLLLDEENITWLILDIVDDLFDGDCSSKMIEPQLDQLTSIEMAMERCRRVDHCEIRWPITKEVTFCKRFANCLHAPTMFFNFMAATLILRDIFEIHYGVVVERLIVGLRGKCVVHSRASERGKDTFDMLDATNSVVSLTKSYSKFDEMHTTPHSTWVQPVMFGTQSAKSNSASMSDIEDNGDNEEIDPMNGYLNDLIVPYKFPSELVEFLKNLKFYIEAHGFAFWLTIGKIITVCFQKLFPFRTINDFSKCPSIMMPSSTTSLFGFAIDFLISLVVTSNVVVEGKHRGLWVLRVWTEREINNNKAMVEYLQKYGVISSKISNAVIETVGMYFFELDHTPSYSHMQIRFYITIFASGQLVTCFELLQKHSLLGIHVWDVGVRHDGMLKEHWHCNLKRGIVSNITRGRVIQRGKWNDVMESYEETTMGYLKRKFGDVAVSSLCAQCKNGQSREPLNLFYKVVNGLDPPMELDSVCEVSMWIHTSSLVDELLGRRDGLM